MVKENPKKFGEIVIYKSSKISPEIKVKFEKGEVWLNRSQLAELFARDIKTIGKHINNALFEELKGFPVVAKFATTGKDGKTYQVEHYSLDMILAVGYRVKSKEGINFRIWATNVLKKYLVDGVAINKHRLEQLNKYLEIISRSEISEVSGVAKIIKNYLPALKYLESYDNGTLKSPKGNKTIWKLTYTEARNFLDELRTQEKFSNNFALERDGSFKGVIAGIYQTFNKRELYVNAEEKAVNLLYQLVKDHTFVDGNKRSAAALFILFLAKNKILKDFNSDTLAAITLMIAVSLPKEKDSILLLIRNFLVNG